MTEKEVIGQENPLGYEKIGKLIFMFAFPSVLSMLVNSLYNIVDQIFIGQGVGYLGNGATNFVLPITIFAIAVGLLFGDGGAAYLSLKLGMGEKEKGSQGVANAMMSQIVTGIVICILVLIFIRPLCYAFGSTEDMIEYAVEYGKVIALGIPATVFSAGLAGIIRADGSPKVSMAGLMVGCIVNIVLDAWFVLGLHWGMFGAGLATIIGQYLNLSIFVWYLWHFKNVELKRHYFKIKWNIWKRVVSLGISSFLTQIAIVVVIVVVNRVLVYYGGLSKYGENIPVTALGITMKFNNILTGIFIGIATGVQPIIGFNYGAGKLERSKKAYISGVIIAMICAAIMTVLFQTIPDKLILIFGQGTPLYMEFCIKCLRVFLCCAVLDGFVTVSSVFFQAIGKPIPAAFSTLLRQTIIMIPAAIIIPIFMGVEGVLLSGPTAGIVSFIVVVFMILPQMKKMRSDTKENTSK